MAVLSQDSSLFLHLQYVPRRGRASSTIGRLTKTAHIIAHSCCIGLSITFVVLCTVVGSELPEATDIRKRKGVNLNSSGTTHYVIKEFYCTDCSVGVEKSTKHCNKCHVCVEHFDHHCVWLNKCIGKRNYRLFILCNIVCLLSLCYSVIYQCTVCMPYSQHHIMYRNKYYVVLLNLETIEYLKIGAADR